jgi:hypothetical protein
MFSFCNAKNNAACMMQFRFYIQKLRFIELIVHLQTKQPVSAS